MAMNSLNRSMGTADSYPFILSDVAIDKLRFVHQVVVSQS
ncbi:MAG TPA: putative zinc-binding metallopeptidase, partial [Polyangia bacterium]|nr:putative zinc-binding metallopeptidase [Polyangia bacterium]